MKEIDALAATGVEIIALDATDRPRPNGLDLDTLFKEARAKYPNQLFMADCSCYEDCKHGLTLETLPIDEYKKVCNAFDEGVYEAINLEKCVRDRKVKGAPCPENVRAAAKEVRTIVNGL